MRKAVLLIHGFVGSLYDNEYLMNYLNLDSKFSVFAKTLPGHQKGDNYQHVVYEEWSLFVENCIKELISYGYQSIYLIGHSMGGVLAGYLASKYKEIKKVVFINAAFQYLNLKQNKVDILTNKDYKDYIEVMTRVLHTSIPFFLEFTKLVKANQNCLENITCDVLVLQSMKDQVVPIENGEKIYNSVKSKNKYLTYLENERHGLFEGNLNDLERKKELSEYIRIYLRGGLKWKKIYKEKI